MAFLLALLMGVLLVLGGCSSSSEESGSETKQSSDKGAVLGSGSRELRILSGSENRELEPILEEYAKENKVKLILTYKGSLDIMRALEEKEFDYDAVWPASSIWMNAGDTRHRIKHAESISINPVVFGIRRSLAQELGFVGKKVSVSDILSAIESGKLKFCMTSATQSNSGASAYLGFIHALSGKEVITSEDLNNTDLQDKLTQILSGVNRSSGSSDWLKEMFVESDYDAMVNYECLMISANQELEKAGKEPLYVVYPYDGLSIADSPLAYVDQGDQDAEECFLDLQKYLLSADVQDQIQKTGRRTGYTGVSEANKKIFSSDWGLDAERVLSPFKMPETAVLEEALNLYQSKLRKPSLTLYCLDNSGSMSGEGNEQLVRAMRELLIQKRARKNYLQASEDDVTILIPFSGSVLDTWSAQGNGPELEGLYEKVKGLEPVGGTDMYSAMEQGLEEMKKYDLSKYTPAIVVMTDGMSDDYYDEFAQAWKVSGKDIPVFSIMYGDADSSQLEDLAKLTNARVFDGRKDLVGAFQKVRGYN